MEPPPTPINSGYPPQIGSNTVAFQPTGNSQPAAYQPSAYQPPAYQPPAYQPPAYQPPAYQPPAYQPPASAYQPLYDNCYYIPPDEHIRQLGPYEKPPMGMVAPYDQAKVRTFEVCGTYANRRHLSTSSSSSSSSSSSTSSRCCHRCKNCRRCLDGRHSHKGGEDRRRHHREDTEHSDRRYCDGCGRPMGYGRSDRYERSRQCEGCRRHDCKTPEDCIRNGCPCAHQRRTSSRPRYSSKHQLPDSSEKIFIIQGRELRTLSDYDRQRFSAQERKCRGCDRQLTEHGVPRRATISGRSESYPPHHHKPQQRAERRLSRDPHDHIQHAHHRTEMPVEHAPREVHLQREGMNGSNMGSTAGPKVAHHYFHHFPNLPSNKMNSFQSPGMVPMRREKDSDVNNYFPNDGSLPRYDSPGIHVSGLENEI